MCRSKRGGWGVLVLLLGLWTALGACAAPLPAALSTHLPTAPVQKGSAPRVEGHGFTARLRLVGPLSAGEAVSIALAQNLRLAIAHQDVLRATAARFAAASALGVQVSTTVVGAMQTSGMIYPGAPGVDPVFYAHLGDRNAVDVNLMAMVPLFTGGRLEALLRGARAREKAELAREAWQLLDVARAARVAYGRVLFAAGQQRVAAWDVAQQRENLDLVEKEFRAGHLAWYVVLRARAELAHARQRNNDAQAAATIARADLKEVMGVDMASHLVCTDPLRLPVAARRESEEMRTALARRPDLIAARLDVTAAAQALAAARARYAPALYGVGMLEGMEQLGHHGPSTWEGGYSVGAELSIPLFDGGERRAEVRASQAGERRHALEVAALELAVTRQVVTARATLAAALANVGLSAQEVIRGREDLRLARLRFEMGRSIQLEIIDALDALARARNDRVAAVYRATVARADLLRATGRLRETR